MSPTTRSGSRSTTCDKPFFVNFPFGYVADNVNWFEGAGIPFAAFDDFGRENAYPLVRVQAKTKSGSGAGHGGHGAADLGRGELPQLPCLQPIRHVPASRQPHRERRPSSVGGRPAGGHQLQMTRDRQHAAEGQPRVCGRHQRAASARPQARARYVSTACDGVPAMRTACTAGALHHQCREPERTDANCLTNKALVQNQPVVCQACHYTPALDLAQCRSARRCAPRARRPTGATSCAHPSNSRVMHYHHGTRRRNGQPLFPRHIPPRSRTAAATSPTRPRAWRRSRTACYQCHPGKTPSACVARCSTAACCAATATATCCRSATTSPRTSRRPTRVPSSWVRTSTPTRQHPAARALGQRAGLRFLPYRRCQSANLTGTSGIISNTRDSLRQHGRHPAAPGLPYRRCQGDARSCRPTSASPSPRCRPPSTASPTRAPAIRKLYRVSTGHGGVMCEGCHGATHAEWPNANPNANDNVTAKQLQGHTGTIVECTTCHGTSEPGQHPERSARHAPDRLQ